MQKQYICALFLALCAVLIPLPVQAQGGCAGGKCGVTTTISPNAGPSGTQVNIRVETNSNQLGGKYEIWWSKSATMQEGDPTMVKLAEGKNDLQARSMDISLSIPESAAGNNYLHFIRAGRAEQMMNFAFQVTPSLITRAESITPRTSFPIEGTGFTAQDSISFSLDGEPIDIICQSDQLGSFRTEFPMPDTMSGTHVIKATAKKLYNLEASLRVKVSPYIKVEPSLPMVGQTATITGYGFASNSEVSISYDATRVTSSPSADKAGRFTYNFTVPETTDTTHRITATDKAGNQAVYELPVESNPPTTPTPVSPTSDRFGIFGAQQVTFNWMPARDDSGNVVYTLEVAENLNFFPLLPNMRRPNLTEPSATMMLEPGTYYWRVQAVDGSGNKSKWALSPYPFQVGLINIWAVAGASLVLLIIFILLLRAFIQRMRGYYS